MLMVILAIKIFLKLQSNLVELKWRIYLFSGAAVLQDKNLPDHPQIVSVFVQIAHDICLNCKVFVHLL